MEKIELESDKILDIKDIEEVFLSLYKISNLPLAVLDSNYEIKYRIGWSKLSESFIIEKQFLSELLEIDNVENDRNQKEIVIDSFILHGRIRYYYKKIFVNGSLSLIIIFGEFLEANNLCIDDDYICSGIIDKEREYEIITFFNMHLSKINSLLDSVYNKKEYITRLEKTEIMYTNLFEKLKQGIAVRKLILNSNNEFLDFVTLDCNEAYEKIWGMKKNNFIGKKASDTFIKIEEHWKKLYEQVVLNKKEMTKEGYSSSLDKYLEITAYPYEKNIFVVLISDVTEEHQNQIKRKRQLMTTVKTLGSLFEQKDYYTAGHQKRVANLSRNIALEMGLSDEKIEKLYVAALLHDIGKVSIPGEILTKPCNLSELEFEMIKIHPQKAYEILRDSDFDGNVAEIIVQHHERLDGSGYPNQLTEESILIEAKILAVADTIEAITSHRPYREALSLDYAVKEILRLSPDFYCSNVVDVTINLIKNHDFSLLFEDSCININKR